MAVDTIKFVDSIAASPTVRLDVNDGTVWRCTRFDASPPRLRRAMSSNAMTDGVFVSSSQYDSRIVTLELALVHSSEDLAATEWQKLARELDRADNFLMYQPTSATKPVFFRLFRSDVPSMEQFTGGAQAFKKPTVELLAEPFALGLRETVSVGTFNNDPAAGSNGCYFDVTGVIGDVAAPTVISDTASTRFGGVIAVRQHGTPSDLTWFAQGESGTMGQDTAVPGGGPDAAMSGSGTNNYARTTFFLNTGMDNRLTVAIPPVGTLAQAKAARGRYSIYAVVRRGDNTSVMTAEAAVAAGNGVTTTTVTLPLTTSRILVRLGTYSLGQAVPDNPGGYAPGVGGYQLPSSITLRAAGPLNKTLDWDCVLLLPADESTFTWSTGSTDSASYDQYLDGSSQTIFAIASGSSPFTNTATIFSAAFDVNATLKMAGGFPMLVPNQTNRLFMVYTTDANGATSKSVTGTIAVDYWPRYLFVRPSAT